MVDELRRRIEAHLAHHPDAGAFGERLLALVDRIDRDFDAEERDRLLRLARDTFARHLATREHTREAREAVAELHADRRRLRALLDLLASGPTEGGPLH
jgi:hypothetical protein